MLEVLRAYFADATVSEVCINGTRGVSVFRGQSHEFLPPIEVDIARLTDKLQDFVFAQGERLDPLQPSAGGVLEAFRWSAVMGPLAVDGPLFSLRRHAFRVVDWSSWRLTLAQRQACEGRLQSSGGLFATGPTGSGKTTFLASLLRARCAEERLVVIEDVPELPLVSPRWIKLRSTRPDIDYQTSISLEQALAEALRLRPDRIVLGELRHREVTAFLHGLLTGHAAVATSVHASSPQALLSRLAWLLASPLEGDGRVRRLLLEAGGATVVMMNRGKFHPGVSGVYELTEENWNVIH